MVRDVELLCGVRMLDEDSRIKDATIRKCGEVTEQIITNESFNSKYSQQFVGRLICSFVESIGEYPVYAEAKKSRFKTIPDVVKRLPVRDVDFLTLEGHKYTFGSIIHLKNVKCDMCSDQASYNVDLDRLKVVGDNDPDEFFVKLPSGFYRDKPSDSNDARLMPYAGKYWNKYYLRAALLEDLLKHERYAKARYISNFNMRVFAETLLRVESAGDKSDGPPEVLDPKYMRMLGVDLFDNLDMYDRQVLREAEQNLPHIEFSLTEECDSCGEDLEILISSSNFFQKAG